MMSVEDFVNKYVHMELNKAVHLKVNAQYMSVHKDYKHTEILDDMLTICCIKL